MPTRKMVSIQLQKKGFKIEILAGILDAIDSGSLAPGLGGLQPSEIIALLENPPAMLPVGLVGKILREELEIPQDNGRRFTVNNLLRARQRMEDLLGRLTESTATAASATIDPAALAAARERFTNASG